MNNWIGEKLIRVCVGSQTVSSIRLILLTKSDDFIIVIRSTYLEQMQQSSSSSTDVSAMDFNEKRIGSFNDYVRLSMRETIVEWAPFSFCSQFFLHLLPRPLSRIFFSWCLEGVLLFHYAIDPHSIQCQRTLGIQPLDDSLLDNLHHQYCISSYSFESTFQHRPAHASAVR